MSDSFIKFEIGEGDWVEMEGDIIKSSSMPVELAEAYVTESMRDEAIVHSLGFIIDRLSKSWASGTDIDPNDLSQEVWLKLLPFRGHPEKWKIRYLTSKTSWIIKTQLQRGGVVEIVPYDQTTPSVQPVDTHPDLYEMIGSLGSERQRGVMGHIASGLSVASIAERMGLTVTQVRSAQSKAMSMLRRMAAGVSDQSREDLLS